MTGDRPALWPKDAQPLLIFLQEHDARGALSRNLPLPVSGAATAHNRIGPGPEGYFAQGPYNARDDVTGPVLQALTHTSWLGIETIYDRIKNRSFRRPDFRVQEEITPDHPQAGALAEFAIWILRNSPDPQPIKYALLLLGALDRPGQEAICMTFARHDEFTYQAQCALLGTRPVGENRDILLRLAKTLTGYGKLDALVPLCEWVEGYFDESDDLDQATLDFRDSFRRWLVRGGYENDLHDDLLVDRAAVFGRLEDQLSEPEARCDIALLDHAARIFAPLFYPARWHRYEGEYGGPGYRDFHDNIEFHAPETAVSAWLDLIANHPPTWQRATVVARIKADVVEQGGLFNLADDPTIVPRADAYLQQPDLADPLRTQLCQVDAFVRREAVLVADMAGVDWWPTVFESTDFSTPQPREHWIDLASTRSPERAERLVMTLCRHLRQDPSDGAGSGDHHPQEGHAMRPADPLGASHVFRMLERFPGLGWPLVEMALRARNDNNLPDKAALTLLAWPKEAWPPEAVPLLRRALEEGVFFDSRAARLRDLLAPRVVGNER